MNINQQSLISLIDSCDFLGKDLVDYWKNNVKRVPEKFYELIYEKFFLAKKKVDDLYAEVELSRDKDGEYQKLVQEKLRSTLKTLNSSQAEQMSESLLNN